jgi:hypothetical protein
MSTAEEHEEGWLLVGLPVGGSMEEDGLVAGFLLRHRARQEEDGGGLVGGLRRPAR